MAEVILDHVYKIYPGEVQAVKDASIEIKDREFVVLVGPSGCGKSTTLRMVAGLEEVSRGEVRIDGDVVNDVPPKDRDIAMVFQNYALYPHMNVRQNMAFGLKLRRFDKNEIDQRVQDAAEILELSPLLDRKPKALSGGQRQRVALGRAIVRKPKVFLFDEPLSNLDAKLRNQMRAEISKLHQRLETTMIYVTHDQVEAMTMGTKIVVMKDGIIHQVDSPMNIYSYPANKFVAGFIGSPTMNFIEGEMTSGVFTSGSITVPLTDSQKKAVADSKVIMGIRPEDLNWGQGSENDGTLNASIDLAEPMGAETHLHLKDNGHKFVARVNPDRTYEVGSPAVLHFNAEQAHYFDLENENALR